MKISRLLFLFPLTLLAACNKDNGEIKTICPLGAPSIVYYDQGNNDNFVTTSATATILGQFQKNEYDAIVIDSSNGLKAIKSYSKSPYRFAKLLTAGNLYLATNKGLSLDNITKDNSVLAFGSLNSIPYLTFKAIYKDATNITRDDGVTNVAAKALENPNSYDYFVLAEPALTSIKNKHNTLTYKKFDLGVAIPQAALFINKDTYVSKCEKFKTYLNELNTRIDNSINKIDVVKESLTKYGDEAKVKQRFGLPNMNILAKVQIDNGLAIYPKDNTYTFTDMNNFLKKIGSEEEYEEKYFINI